MSAVRRRVDQHVGAGSCDRAVEHHLERLVARLAGVEREIVAEHDEALASRRRELGDIGQIDEIALVDLDQTQTLARVLVEHRLHERRLAGAARTRQQHVVRRKARQELPRVLVDRALLLVDRDQVVEADQMRVRNRLQMAASRALAPAECSRAPIGWRRRRR
jgi:hypothetical protein